MSEKEYQVALSLVPYVGHVTAKNLLAYFGSAEKIFHAPKSKMLAISGIGEKIANSIMKANVFDQARKIIAEAEKHYEIQGKRPKPNKDSETYLSDTVCLNAPQIAENIGAKCLIGVTVSGYTAFKMSSFRPNCRIFIFSDREDMLSTLNLVWGVRCYQYNKFTTTDETIEDLINILKEENEVQKGDVVVNAGSMPLHKRFRTNMLKITVVE